MQPGFWGLEVTGVLYECLSRPAYREYREKWNSMEMRNKKGRRGRLGLKEDQTAEDRSKCRAAGS